MSEQPQLIQPSQRLSDERIVARAIEAAIVPQWLPIETAPKDGIFLLALPVAGNLRDGDRRVYEGRWHKDQATWTSVNGFLLLTGATHWMPLPPPPKDKP